MYIIQRRLQLDPYVPEVIHYYTKNGTTKVVKEAKRFLTKIGAKLWLKLNYRRVENIYTDFYYFVLIKLKKETLENDK